MARTPLAVSAGLYERLLRLYPRRYRAEYGAAMAQLFRDLARDAYADRQGWGLAGLWVRVLADTGRSAGTEHWLALESRLRQTCRVDVGWLRAGWPAYLAATLIIVAGIFGKSVAVKQLHSAIGGAGMIVGAALLAAVLLDRTLRAGGQLLAASAVVILSLVLPLAWTPNALEWLRLNPITAYTVTLLPFASQRGQLPARNLWGSALLYAVTNVFTSALIGP
jgi:hypothetical protein